MNPECPEYRPPMMFADPVTDKVYEGAGMCSIVDKFCLLENGKPEDCETYMEYLNELKQEEGTIYDVNWMKECIITLRHTLTLYLKYLFYRYILRKNVIGFYEGKPIIYEEEKQ